MTLRTSRTALALALVLVTVACSHRAPQTPRGQALAAATEVTLRVEQLQNAAISANALGALPDSEAILIVRFTYSAAKIAKEIPNGWIATIDTAYTTMKGQLAATTKANATVQATLATLDALILTLKQGREDVTGTLAGHSDQHRDSRTGPHSQTSR